MAPADFIKADRLLFYNLARMFFCKLRASIVDLWALIERLS